MKTTKILTLAFLLIIFGLNIKASETDSIVNYTMLKMAKQEIAHNIKYPELAQDELIEGVVSASFVINENGKLNITAINGHPMLIESVRKQLEQMKLNYSNAQSDLIIMRFKFQLL